jgi:hypothetical protein
VTNKNKRRPAAYREPSTPHDDDRPAAAPRRGLLDGFFAPRFADPSVPKKSISLFRGAIAAASSPALVVSVILSVFVAWLALIAAGFQGPFSVMASLLALPPVGIWFDVAMTSRLFGASGLLAVFILIAIRSVLLGLFASFGVDALMGVRTDRWSVVRALRILPVTLAVCLLGLGLTTLGDVLILFMGPGIGLLLAVASLAAGVYLFGFAPAIAVAEGRNVPESLARSVRAARMPGSSNLMLAAFYALGALAIFVTTTGGKLGVDPSPEGWAVVLLVNFLHVAVLTALAFRYLSVAGEVAEAPARSKTAGGGRSRPS